MGSSQEQLREIASRLHFVEINLGCGRRPCRICHVNAPRYQRSMPFEQVKRVHRLEPTVLKGEVYHHYRGDPLYWQDEDGEVTYAEVVRDALWTGWTKVYLTTHGWLPDEAIPAEAVRRLVRYYYGNPGLFARFSVEFSVDPYGWLGVEEGLRGEAIKDNLRKLEPFEPLVRAFYNPNDQTGRGSKEEMRQWLKQVLPGFFGIEWRAITTFGNDRASRLTPMPPQSRKQYWRGYLLTIDGDLLWADVFTRVPLKMGNLWEMSEAGERSNERMSFSF